MLKTLAEIEEGDYYHPPGSTVKTLMALRDPLEVLLGRVYAPEIHSVYFVEYPEVPDGPWIVTYSEDDPCPDPSSCAANYPPIDRPHIVNQPSLLKKSLVTDSEILSRPHEASFHGGILLNAWHRERRSHLFGKSVRFAQRFRNRRGREA
jgi:hypothetical protein